MPANTNDPRSYLNTLKHAETTALRLLAEHPQDAEVKRLIVDLGKQILAMHELTDRDSSRMLRREDLN